MKAIRKMTRESWSLGMGEQDEPKTVGPNDVKIKVAFAGICGSDAHILEEDAGGLVPKPSPLTLGHEFSGVVTEVGENVPEFKVGDKVTSQPGTNFCIDCTDVLRYGVYACKNKRSLGYETQGCMTEYVVMNKAVVHKLPDNISLEEGALTEPACVAAHAVFDHVNILPSDLVVVVGDGPIGLLTAACVKTRGATVVLVGTSASANRLNIGKELGADYIFMSDKTDVIAEVNKLTNGLRADVVFECVGFNQTIDMSIMMTKKKGTMVLVGNMGNDGSKITPMMFAIMTEIRIQPTFGHTYATWGQVLKLMSQGKLNVKPVISHKFAYDDYQKAFDTVFKTREGVKVLLHP